MVCPSKAWPQCVRALLVRTAGTTRAPLQSLGKALPSPLDGFAQPSDAVDLDALPIHISLTCWYSTATSIAMRESPTENGHRGNRCNAACARSAGQQRGQQQRFDAGKNAMKSAQRHASAGLDVVTPPSSSTDARCRQSGRTAAHGAVRPGAPLAEPGTAQEAIRLHRLAWVASGGRLD